MTDLVTVTVVAYNDADMLEGCIRSVRSTTDSRILIIDNFSDDATPQVTDLLAHEISNVDVARTERNGGYAYGVNRAREQVTTPYIAIMNADCTTTGDWVSPCVSALEADPTIGACSPTLGLMTDSRLNAEGLSIHKTGFGFNRHLGHPAESAASNPSVTPGVQGTAFVIRTAALDTIGGWYEGGFLYHEDVELSWALRVAGYSTWHIPTPPVLHDYTLTMSPEKFFLLERNRIEMLAVYLRPLTLLVLSPVLLASEIAVWLYAARARAGLPGAKGRSYRSFRSRHASRSTRRDQVGRTRIATDRQLLATMQWRFPRGQIGVLTRSETSKGRRGDRPMPTD